MIEDILTGLVRAFQERDPILGGLALISLGVNWMQHRSHVMLLRETLERDKDTAIAITKSADAIRDIRQVLR